MPDPLLYGLSKRMVLEDYDVGMALVIDWKS